jgi:cell division septation protein DedD
MRNLFLVLLLANLAFAAWHAWFSEPARPAHSVDPSLPGITLVNELPAGDAAANGPDRGADSLGAAKASSSDVTADLGDSPKASPGGASSLPSITLVKELPDDLAALSGAGGAAAEQGASTRSTDAAGARVEETAPAAPARPGRVTGASRCTSVGPFRELAQAATAAATLRTAGYKPTQRVSEGDIWIGYWVYIEAIPTVALANEILAKVRAEGVTDSYVIPNSDSGNLVSLGVFSEISGVSRRRDQVRALGYEPKVVDRTRRATVYWVDVVLTGEQVLDFDALQTPGRIIRLEQRSCEASAA